MTGGAETPVVLVVYGTRPEAIKLAPIIRALQRDPRFELRVAVTGQHRDMLRRIHAVFGIVPDIDLDIMSPGQSLNQIIARTVAGLDPVLERLRPAAVIVQGDTSTVAATALAAFNRQIPIVHVEAGLRTGDLASPFPEEGNRKLVGQLAALHLAPTADARANLLREGVDPAAIAVTGNTVIDALQHAVAAQTARAVPEGQGGSGRTGVRAAAPTAEPAGQASVLERLLRASAVGRRILLLTTHRRENWGAPMRDIARALAHVARRHPDALIAWPAHPNPVVRDVIAPELAGLDNVMVMEPLDYPDFTRLLAVSHVVITDSGGVQEEAPSLGKPVLVLRETTERPAAVTSGAARLVGTSTPAIVAAVEELLGDPLAYAAMARAINPYGDGHAAERGIAALAQLLGSGSREPDFVPGTVAEVIAGEAIVAPTDSLGRDGIGAAVPA
ncbi:UDP-N-acetylglucosamine 2-epimerase (non-hydrolyzing) [Brevibacterium sp. 91QC2O2]|uniref:non-hydrolyzing UDP-N-acetylglucosamine 2-epimerase n=1 Tax=Brevibacterium sp. 91QC2O2 TaxID=2968458 RepID=UPI00211C92D2|nr:UDP-N-acetylglucosamine 2-epimerase (non-hydrolyzing) [Brevibacterium sp. 91QC2O2]MCQ9369446.1 UDP-N-acetylglucosamine 2-epimerase (non-hydrolyzing) [Brevibacterium sp. 91QC2O2]